MSEGNNALELEHVIGFTGKYGHTISIHPRNSKYILYPIGGVLVVGDINDPHNQQFLTEHDEEITCVALTNSGRLLATAQIGTTKRKGQMATVIVWELAKKKVLFRIESHLNRVMSLSFTHDDKFLAVSDGSGKVSIWDTQTGQLAGGAKIDRPAFFVTSSPLTPDFNPRRPSYTFIIATDNSIQVCSWAYEAKAMQFVLSTRICQLPGRIAGFQREYLEACIDESGEFCYAGTKTGEIMVFNIKNAIYRNSIQVSSSVMSLCNEKDILYCGCSDGSLKMLQGNDTNWKIKKETKLVGRVTSLSLHSEQRVLMAGTDNGKIYRLNVDTLESELIEESHIREVTDVAFSSEKSDQFCSCSSDGTIRVWDLENYFTLNTFVVATQTSKPTCIIYVGEKVVTGWSDGFIRCFNTKTNQQDWQIVNTHKGGVTSLDCDGKILVSGGHDGVVRLWSMRNQEMFGQFSDHTKPVTGVKIDVGQAHLLHTTSMDKFVYTYDLQKNKRIVFHSIADRSCPGFTGISQRLDNELEVITCGSDGKIRFWDIDFPDQVDMFEDKNTQISAISVSPSGKYLASCGNDGLVKVWDMKTKQVIGKGSCTAVVCKCSWSPDEKQIITCAVDASISVWNFYLD
ncbi:hypothetical protein FDP41_009847 [Naegleria fowleri]|uniref:Uncharacterized protein n=1 Tax=Naegleria fowleri TaxID=5763 RepID=A0A6A5BBY7_NAEFO|nr:uncharacterized protein FDP41_009847 [Naegleria fowleri]KAF0971624.1 hypothetical protein FDP41_009847 [Naegleria fowleri]CAG4709446.1 unnamed protein product [Naegleria fowleri]